MGWDGIEGVWGGGEEGEEEGFLALHPAPFPPSPAMGD